MKNIFKKTINSIKSGIKKLATKMSFAVSKLRASVCSARAALAGSCGEGYIDTGVKIIIGVVIGGVILAALYTLFNSTIMPTLNTEISEMFNYGG